jgi:hypothetical protein
VEIQPMQPTTKAPAQTFTGMPGTTSSPPGTSHPGSGSTWCGSPPGPATPGMRTLSGRLCTSPRGSGIKSRGGQVTEIRPGNTIYTPPGEWHWHGAAPGHFMTHLAMWESPGEGHGPETQWGDLVTDDEYHARPAPGAR